MNGGQALTDRDAVSSVVVHTSSPCTSCGMASGAASRGSAHRSDKKPAYPYLTDSLHAALASGRPGIRRDLPAV